MGIFVISAHWNDGNVPRSGLCLSVSCIMVVGISFSMERRWRRVRDREVWSNTGIALDSRNVTYGLGYKVGDSWPKVDYLDGTGAHCLRSKWCKAYSMYVNVLKHKIEACLMHLSTLGIRIEAVRFSEVRWVGAAYMTNSLLFHAYFFYLNVNFVFSFINFYHTSVFSTWFCLFELMCSFVWLLRTPYR